jgi:hypothetical protein
LWECDLIPGNRIRALRRIVRALDK